jgi:catechol 2,3-dioxygenase-like lactoylglutathione lyase family enzyme
MQPRVSLITLGVRDLERCQRFYRDGLGWPLSSASVEGEVAFFKSGGAILALWHRAELLNDAGLSGDGSGFGGVALAHNVSGKAEVDDVLRQAEAAGGTVTRAAVETDWGGYNGYFADPEGFVWEVAWNPHWPLAADGSVQLPD